MPVTLVVDFLPEVLNEVLGAVETGHRLPSEHFVASVSLSGGDNIALYHEVCRTSTRSQVIRCSRCEY